MEVGFILEQKLHREPHDCSTQYDVSGVMNGAKLGFGFSIT
jgi:hypothetical protein